MCLFRGVDPTLDRRRIFAYCLIALIVEIVVFLYLIAGTHGLIVPLSKPTSRWIPNCQYVVTGMSNLCDMWYEVI
jgi:hypothetical protein